MEQQAINELIAKYNEGLADPSEVRELENLIEAGTISLTALSNLQLLDENISRMVDPKPSLDLDQRFYAMLNEEKKKANRQSFESWLPSWNLWLPRLAFGIVLLTAGFTIGYLVNKPEGNGDVASLTQEVTDLKEMVMLSLLEKESATDRLKAVSLTNEMDQASKNVTQALIKTLNQDNNVNVRLAALDALRPYVGDGNVRELLVKSIANQDSPMVQIALAQLMVELQEKKSVDELRKLLKGDNTPKEVKARIEESIEVLI